MNSSASFTVSMATSVPFLRSMATKNLQDKRAHLEARTTLAAVKLLDHHSQTSCSILVVLSHQET